MKRLLKGMLLLILCISLIGCSQKSIDDKNESMTVNKQVENRKIKIVTSFNPISEFAKAVGGEKVEVITLMPAGSEPHDFEPKAKDIVAIDKADIFLYNGFGMENWVEKTLEVIENKKLITLECSKGVDPIKNSDEATIKEHGQYDPHTWLSLTAAKTEAENIKKVLITVDSQNKEYYEKNYKIFSQQCDGLFNEYQDKFSLTKNKDFVAGHAAFAYLCRDFGLKQNSVEDVFAEGEPTSKNIERLVKYCRDNNVKTIFVEELASPKVSETLANEVDGNVKKIYTLESKEDNKNYIESMEDNLKEIYDSLK